ncbi:hypothetical protein [Lentiprolixibacter aurantiacus]
MISKLVCVDRPRLIRAEIIPNEPARVMPGREVKNTIWMYSVPPE